MYSQYSKVKRLLLAAIAIMISVFTTNINYFMYGMDYITCIISIRIVCWEFHTYIDFYIMKNIVYT